MSKYICRNCCTSFSLPKKPTFCPFCGEKGDYWSVDAKREKAKDHAEDVLHQMRGLVPQIEKAWSKYADLYVQFEALKQVVIVYERRGYIKKSDIPTVNKVALSQALREYRSGNKEE